MKSDTGFTLGYDKYNWQEHPDHFILADCRSAVDFGEGKKGTPVSQIHPGYQFDRFNRPMRTSRVDEDIDPYRQTRKFCRGRCPHRPLSPNYLTFEFYETGVVRRAFALDFWNRVCYTEKNHPLRNVCNRMIS